MKREINQQTEQPKRQPEAAAPDRKPAADVNELDLDQMSQVSGGAQNVPPEWLMKNE